ncbi:MAG: hypothetical protein M1831_001568 [Alyxoria varia]|nr:MAG: hypothetical protein M1831_001568 [Alyxoria varia]
MFHPQPRTPPRARAHTSTTPIHGTFCIPNPSITTLTHSISGLGSRLLSSYYKSHIRSYATVTAAKNYLLNIQSAADTLAYDIETIVRKHGEEVQRGHSLTASLLNLRTDLSYWMDQAKNIQDNNALLQQHRDNERERKGYQLRIMKNTNNRLESLCNLQEEEIGDMAAEMEVLRYQRDEAARINLQWQTRHDALMREWNRVNARFRDEQVKNEDVVFNRVLDKEAYETHIEVIEKKRKDDKAYIAQLEKQLDEMKNGKTLSASNNISSAPFDEREDSVEDILSDMITASEGEILALHGITTGMQTTVSTDCASPSAEVDTASSGHFERDGPFRAWIEAVQEAGPHTDSSFSSLEDSYADDEHEDEEPEYRSISELYDDSDSDFEDILPPPPLFSPLPLFTAQNAATAIAALRPNDASGSVSSDSDVDVGERLPSLLDASSFNAAGEDDDSGVDMRSPSLSSNQSSSSEESSWTLADYLDEVDIVDDYPFLNYVVPSQAPTQTAPAQLTTERGESPILPYQPWTFRPVLGTPSTSSESMHALFSQPANPNAFARVGGCTSPVFIIGDDDDDDDDETDDMQDNSCIVDDELDLLDELEELDFGAVIDDDILVHPRSSNNLQDELQACMNASEEIEGDEDADTVDGLMDFASPSSIYSARFILDGEQDQPIALGGLTQYTTVADVQRYDVFQAHLPPAPNFIPLEELEGALDGSEDTSEESINTSDGSDNAGEGSESSEGAFSIGDDEDTEFEDNRGRL